jgi:hypothetical protein
MKRIMAAAACILMGMLGAYLIRRTMPTTQVLLGGSGNYTTTDDAAPTKVWI